MELIAKNTPQALGKPVAPAVLPAAEIKILTLLRGVAAMSVFLFHLICVSGGYITNEILYNIFHFGKYGVQFFFVISGFVITYSMLQANYKVKYFFTFLKKRFIRIEPPYVVIVLLTFSLMYLRARSGLGNNVVEYPEWKALLLHFGYLIPFSNYEWLSIVFWTLAVEFQFYILFSFLLPAFRTNWWLRWLTSAVLIVLYFLSSYGVHFIDWSPVFLLGIYLALYKKKIINATELWIAASLFAGCIFYKLGWVIFTFSAVPFLVINFEPKIRSRLWEFFGRISYSLYLSHTLIAFTIINLGIRFKIYGYQKIAVVLAAFALTVLFSFLLYYYVERPFKSLASSIKYTKKSGY